MCRPLGGQDPTTATVPNERPSTTTRERERVRPQRERMGSISRDGDCSIGKEEPTTELRRCSKSLPMDLSSVCWRSRAGVQGTERRQHETISLALLVLFSLLLLIFAEIGWWSGEGHSDVRNWHSVLATSERTRKFSNVPRSQFSRRPCEGAPIQPPAPSSSA
jgi:hypothetical protein